jgi:hypothetical protein
MIVVRAIDPIPQLITWVYIGVREVPWETGTKDVIVIPVRSIRGGI